jgi:hypothetical protein
MLHDDILQENKTDSTVMLMHEGVHEIDNTHK